MGRQSSETKGELLQVIYPDLYRRLTKSLSELNIHSFDIRATCRTIGDEIEVRVLYGERFAHEKTEVFAKEILEETDNRFEEFCEALGEICKKRMIEDYFKMVSP